MTNMFHFLFLALDILVVTPLHSSLETKLDKGNTFPATDNDATSEIISIRKRRKIWSAKTKYAAEYPSRRRSWSYGEPRLIERVMGGFGGELDGAIIVGNYQSVYQYDVEKDKWVNIDKNSQEKEPRGESAKGCKIGNCFLVYGEKAELLQFKPWLTKIYDSFPNGSRDDDSSEEDNQIQSVGNRLGMKGMKVRRIFLNQLTTMTISVRLLMKCLFSK